MNAIVMNTQQPESKKYQQCLANARKVNWDIEKDVIRSRSFNTRHKYLPDSLTMVNELTFLTGEEQRFLSQIQGRSYAYIFGLVERFIGAKVMELVKEHALADQVATEALVQFSAEELKHQALFRRIESLAEATLPNGYRMMADPSEVAKVVLSKSTWAVLGLTCHIEIFTQAHYLASIKCQADLSPLFRDVFKFHWLEESQHATLDELEWNRVHQGLNPEQVDASVHEFIDLVVAVDTILQAQADSDAAYFTANCDRKFSSEQQACIHDLVLRAYRWQYIVSGVQVERFQRALSEKITDLQLQRIFRALAPIVDHVKGGAAP